MVCVKCFRKVLCICIIDPVTFINNYGVNFFRISFGELLKDSFDCNFRNFVIVYPAFFLKMNIKQNIYIFILNIKSSLVKKLLKNTLYFTWIFLESIIFFVLFFHHEIIGMTNFGLNICDRIFNAMIFIIYIL